jgi:hypothetical protein
VRVKLGLLGVTTRLMTSRPLVGLFGRIKFFQQSPLTLVPKIINGLRSGRRLSVARPPPREWLTSTRPKITTDVVSSREGSSICQALATERRGLESCITRKCLTQKKCETVGALVIWSARNRGTLAIMLPQTNLSMLMARDVGAVMTTIDLGRG